MHVVAICNTILFKSASRVATECCITQFQTVAALEIFFKSEVPSLQFEMSCCEFKIFKTEKCNQKFNLSIILILNIRRSLNIYYDEN